MTQIGWALGIVALAVVTVSGVAAFRCPAGWKAWLLYKITVIYTTSLHRWQLNGTESLPAEGPAIIVANHCSPVDPTLVWRGHRIGPGRRPLRVIGFMMAQEYFYRGGIVTWVCRAMESIPVDRNGRDMAPVRNCLQRLKEGRLVGIFPEGRINVQSPETKLRKAGTGVAYLALKSGVPVIPAFIHGAPRSKSMLSCFLKPAKVRVTYGQPVDLTRYQDRKPTSAVLADATDSIMKALADAGGIEFTPCSPGGSIPEPRT